jgi:aryl-alcohol dehydrogenase-like predicted oxidoreductase
VPPHPQSLYLVRVGCSRAAGCVGMSRTTPSSGAARALYRTRQCPGCVRLVSSSVATESTALIAHKFQSVAAKHNKTVAQVLLRWGMEKGAIIIPGTGNPVHQKENLDVYGFALDASDMELIKECSEDEGAKHFFYLNPDES